MVSKNALLCGGSNEIAFDGKNVLDIPIFFFFSSVSDCILLYALVLGDCLIVIATDIWFVQS